MHILLVDQLNSDGSVLPGWAHLAFSYKLYKPVADKVVAAAMANEFIYKEAGKA
jgi:hypothetical protein